MRGGIVRELNDGDEIGYDEIIEILTDLPQTWIPSLFFYIADECRRRGVWADGREAQVVGHTLNATIDRAAELLLQAADNMPDTFAQQYRDTAKNLRSDAPETFLGVDHNG